ncbi:hypothetical protein [Pontibacter fetidus]|uniref:Uncharacterized protein n=1 Tax=Pontibacter fetidus TaxID=2700082 RepID=A0A6B2H6H3_9BACT|nr:hypothetical protein [Pontibacter fetidus]NDK56416.1 hypothetical protein [Pontibacter fetidus]
MKKYKIGTMVILKSQPNKMFEIIANSETPYAGLDASPFHQPTHVNLGYDYLLRELNTKGKFRPFQHVRESEVEEIKMH